MIIIVITNSPFKPGDFSTGSTTDMESTVWKFTMESSIWEKYGNYNISLLMPE